MSSQVAKRCNHFMPVRACDVIDCDWSANRVSTRPSYRNPQVRRWASHLWGEAVLKTLEPVRPAIAKPAPAAWSDAAVTAAWIGHSTVLMNLCGVRIITDPVLFSRIGVRIPFLFTIGPKRLTAPALKIDELSRIDLILLSHAHFDHIDWRTLRHIGRLNPGAKVITATRTRDLFRWMKFSELRELDWGEGMRIATSGGDVDVTAIPVKHWGARMQSDDFRGYNAYLIEKNRRRILFAGDTALIKTFATLRQRGPIDLAIFGIGAYNPWIGSHSSPEQAVKMANDAGARYIMPVHHQTFRLSFEPMGEPIERFEDALRHETERIALREIGETFVLPHE